MAEIEDKTFGSYPSSCYCVQKHLQQMLVNSFDNPPTDWPIAPHLKIPPIVGPSNFLHACSKEVTMETIQGCLASCDSSRPCAGTHLCTVSLNVTAGKWSFIST
mmetsp:Transcript_32094/g.97826  ORF Transcript_32094/g.97826 Transcript_32094/m.97826 type:complete len:104 (-) Transcript_32094:692-1003(-)